MFKKYIKYLNYFLILTLMFFSFTNQVKATWTYYNFSIPYTVGIPVPLPPTNVVATPGACGTNDITISWNASVGASSYNVLRSTSLNGSYNSIASGLSNSPYNNTGLVVGTTYYYVVQASNSSGTSPSSAQAFTVAPSNCTLPDLIASTPTPSVAAVGTSVAFSSNIQNIGTASTGTSFPNFFQLASMANGGGTLTDLSSSTNIALVAGAGNSTTSPYQTFTTAGTYSIRACADKSNSLSSGVITESNENNNCSGWMNVVVTNSVPAAPTGVIAVADTCGAGTIKISWNVSAGASSYNVLRSTTSGSGYVSIASGITGTSYSNVSGLTPGVTYYYVVQAVSAAGTSPNSAEAFTSIVDPSGCTSIPDLIISNRGPSSATVGNPTEFSAIVSNIGTASTGTSFPNFFQLASMANGGGTLTDLTSVTSAALNASATNIIYSPDQTFTTAGTYSIRACADKSNSLSSGVITESNENNNCSGWMNVVVTVNLPPIVDAGPDQTIQLPTSSTSLSGTGTDPEGDIRYIEWDFISGPSTPTISTPYSSFSTVITGLTKIGTYTFRLIVTDEEGGTTSDDVNVTVTSIIPIGPTGVGASAGVCGTHTIKISWNVSAGASSYNVLRSTTSGSGYVSIASGITGTSYSNVSGLTPGVTYYYVVQAVSAAGTSPNSLQVSAVAPVVCNIADLTASTPTPITAYAGVPISFSSTISNIGNASTNVSFTNKFNVSTAPNGGGSISDLSFNSMSALGSGANSTAVSSPYIFPSIGTYSVQVCTDFYSVVSESNENNNCSGWTNVNVGPSISCLGTGSGTGLTGNYYDGTDFNRFVSTHVDGNINFPSADFLGADYADSPDGGTFSVSWVGQIQPTCTEDYTFYTYTDDGTRLWINGNLIIDKWVNQGATTWSSPPITLTAGVKYDIRMDYFDNYPTATAQLFWSSSSINKQVIPKSQLYSTSFADLTASFPTPAGVSIGIPVKFTSTISNIGSGSTGTSFPNFFQLASMANGGGTLTDLSSSTNIALVAGAGNPIESPAQTFTTIGTYSIQACADKANRGDTGVINELNELNNCSGWTNIVVTDNPPSIPLNVTAIAGACGTTIIDVNWQSTPGASSYNVLRSTTSGGPYTLIKSGVTGTSYSDNSSLVAGNTYYYVVQAVNGSGTSSNSAQAFTPISSGCNGPDLTASAPTQTVANVGTPIQFTSTISNIGATTTGTSFFNFFQVSTTNDSTGVVTDLSPIPMATLSSGSGSTITSSPYTFLLTGINFVRACANQTDSKSPYLIGESNYGNDCSSPWTKVTVSGSLPPPIASLVASPTLIIAGQSSILTWSSSGADSCVGTNFNTGNATSNGVGISVTPLTTTTYGLTCTNSSTGLSGTSFITINVDARKQPNYSEH